MSEKFGHFPKATHLKSSLHGELSHSKSVAFPLTTTAVLDSGLCSDVLRPILTTLKYQQVPSVTLIPLLYFILLPNTYNHSTSYLLIPNVRFMKEGHNPFTK